MQMRPVLAVAVLMLGLGPASRADDLVAASESLCEKVKACSLSQLKEEDLTPEVRQMMQPMLDNMCVNMRGKVGEVPSGHPLYAPATDCMRSMAALGCEQMMDSDQVKTPECEEYRKLAQETAPNP